MLKQVTDIVDAIGKDDFCDSLSRFCEESVEAAEVALFYFPANDNPQCLSTDVRVHDAVVEYVEGAYHLDANLQGLRSKLDENNEFAIGSLHKNQIKDSGYSSKFYERTGVEKKLSLVAQIETGFVYGNFYRRPNQPDFDAQDEQKLQSIWKLCLSCFNQHARIASISVPDFTDRKARLEVVRKFLRAEGLSKREADVTSHIVLGYSTTAIALHLNIAENTVSTLRRRAYEKLGISSQNQLFEICFRRINDVMRGKPDEHYERFIKEGLISL